MNREDASPRPDADNRSPTAGRRPRWIAAAAAAAVLMLAVALSLHPIATTDFFWQLRAGDWIRQEGGIPRTDPFSFTAEGRPWIDLHWGFQIVVSILHGWFGPDGLTLFRALVVGFTTALLLFGFTRRRTGTIAAAVVLLVLLASHERFLIRPELLSFPLLVVFLMILERGVKGMRDPIPYLLIPILIVWVNLHSLFILGVALLVAALIGEAIDFLRHRSEGWRPDRLRPSGPESLRVLSLVTAAGVVGCLLNPFGWRAFSLPLLQFTRRISTGNPYSGSIAEFQQPFDAGAGTFAITTFWFLAAATGLAVVLRGRRLPTRQILIVVAFFLLAWRARRNLPLFAIAAVPVLIEAGGAAVRCGWPARWKRRAAWAGRVGVVALALLLTAAVCTDRLYVWERMDRRFGSGVLAGLAPQGAVDFVSDRFLSGRIFHSLDDGGFLLWRFYPQRQVFIDGRLEVYDEATFTEYLRALEDPERFEALAARHGIQTVLWNHSKALIANRLLRYLMRSPDWYPVYIDSVSIVFRRMAGAAAAGEPPPVDLGQQPPGEVLERGVGPPTRLDRILTGWVPWPRQPFLTEVRLGILYALLGFAPQAESCLLRATSLPAVPAEARFDLGLVYDGMGLTEKAILEYEEARRASGLLREPLGWLFRRDFRRDLLLHLGSAYIQAGMEDRGVPLLERSGRRGHGRLLAFEGYQLQSEGDNAAAAEKYREALVQDPESPEILHNLGLALIRAGVDRLDAGGDPDPLVEEAAAAFRRAIEARPDFASAHFNLGLVLMQQGQTEQAIESFARAADLDPTDPGFRYQLGYAQLQAGHLPEAAAALSEAIRLQPEFPQARFHLGLTLQGMGDWAGALESFRTCVQQGMQDARVALQIAQIHARQGDTDEALLWIGRTGMSVPELRSVVGGVPELAPLIDRIEAGEAGQPQ